jgi:hypothetical protein
VQAAFGVQVEMKFSGSLKGYF